MSGLTVVNTAMKNHIIKIASIHHHLTIPVNHFLVSYDDLGEGNVPVIFLHGFPFDKSMWQGQLASLKTDYRVIACDIRGFGKSTDEVSSLSMDLFGEDLVAFMNTLHIKKAIVCGLSMGGFIALNAVQRFPDRFAALILCDTQCIADTAEIKTKRYKSIDAIAVNGVTDFNEGFLKKVFHADSFRDKKELVESLRKVVFANSPHIISMGLTALAARAETCSALSGIRLPTLIICGRGDSVTPLAQSESMHTAIEGSVLQVIEDAGHVSNLEQPQLFNKHLLDFLSAL